MISCVTYGEGAGRRADLRVFMDVGVREVCGVVLSSEVKYMAGDDIGSRRPRQTPLIAEIRMGPGACFPS